MIWRNLREIWTFCHFVTSEGFYVIFMKQQTYHNSPGWPLIVKMSTLFLLQLLKLKKIKCLYFLDYTSFEEDISFLSFYDSWWFFQGRVKKNILMDPPPPPPWMDYVFFLGLFFMRKTCPFAKNLEKKNGWMDAARTPSPPEWTESIKMFFLLTLPWACYSYFFTSWW